ncbi:unnamed protein product [Protopolystoma xenopodis]|uniref:PID domain-containing protein n=1 Tax=Protopolystoma xenopodis TaxID=117903 RepID=A0A3S4ZU60_9PLAT|nr:unnamed protein product [Protopolystoma xenopodis]
MLSCPITVCRQHPELLVGHYCDDSIIGNEILLEIFSSLIAELDRLSISLDLENVDFLDKSLRVPLFRKYEFVPCRELGLAVRSIDGHMVVDDLDPEGVSAEDGRIEIGDVITSLFRRPLRRQPINIRSLLSLFDGKPVLADVIKARQPDGSLYQPIFNMLKENRCMDLLQRSSATSSHSSVKRGTENRVDNPKKAQLAYIGNINVGSNGGIGRLEWAILRMLDQCPDKAEYLPVSLTSGELGLTIREISPDSDEASQNNPPLLKHSFPQISAVGRRLESPLCLAYIAGDTTCTLSKRFTCHIFKAESSQYAQELVETIAQGFTRTHWAL